MIYLKKPALPRDQISTSNPYGILEITSGLIQYGVPTNDFLFCWSGVIWAQNPKSDIFTVPFDDNSIESIKLKEKKDKDDVVSSYLISDLF